MTSTNPRSSPHGSSSGLNKFKGAIKMSDSIDFKADPNYERYESYADSETNMGFAFFSDETVRAQMSKDRHIKFMDSINETLCDLEGDFKSASAELKAKIDECDDPVMKQQLAGALDELKNTWKQITHHPPGMHRELGEFGEMWNERISNMRNGIVDASLVVRASEEMSMIGAEALQISKPPQAVEHHGRDTASRIGLSASGATDAGEYADLGDLDVERMMNLMTSDPQAAMAELKNLTAEDRAIAMQMISQQLQNMNQMFSMMSNVAKTLHDTSKSIINNMRV